MPIKSFPEMLSQAILVGIILVGRLGVAERWLRLQDLPAACEADPGNLPAIALRPPSSKSLLNKKK